MIEPERQQAERSERPRSDRRGEGGGYGRRGQALTVVVDDRGIEAALRVFKKLVLKEGLLEGHQAPRALREAWRPQAPQDA